MTRGEFTPAAAEEGKKRMSQRLAIVALFATFPRGVRRSELKHAGGDRFSARVNELRRDGFRIVGPVKAPRWGINERSEPWEDGEDRYILTAQPRCPDCGAPNETAGHMTCAYPENHP